VGNFDREWIVILSLTQVLKATFDEGVVPNARKRLLKIAEAALTQPWRK